MLHTQIESKNVLLKHKLRTFNYSSRCLLYAIAKIAFITARIIASLHYFLQFHKSYLVQQLIAMAPDLHLVCSLVDRTCVLSIFLIVPPFLGLNCSSQISMKLLYGFPTIICGILLLVCSPSQRNFESAFRVCEPFVASSEFACLPLPFHNRPLFSFSLLS